MHVTWHKYSITTAETVMRYGHHCVWVLQEQEARMTWSTFGLKIGDTNLFP